MEDKAQTHLETHSMLKSRDWIQTQICLSSELLITRLMAALISLYPDAA